MYFIYIFVCALSTVAAQSATAKLSFLPTLETVVGGISEFTGILNNFYDIFSILVTDNITDIQGNLSVSVPEDAYLNISQLAKKYGYPLEVHKPVTEDGYILNIHRIPHGRNGKRNNITVFLMHGILDSSDSWVIQGPERALCYILADEGFDVWMGNARGNKYATEHVLYNTSHPEFWKFTWEEIGIYDTARMIDHILYYNGNRSIYYIGHSQGTTTFYVMNSMKPEYNEKIKMMFSMAPVAWMTHVRSPLIRLVSPGFQSLSYYLSDLNVYVPSITFFNKISAYVCSVLSVKCDNLLQMIVGTDWRSINGTMMPIMLGHMFSGSSTLQFVHYGQLVQSKRFCRFDFGPEVNSKRYGVQEPPDYDLSKITIPVGLFYSSEDWVADPYDVNLLKQHLPNVFMYEFLGDYNHLDYLYASDNKERVFSKIIKSIYDFEHGRNSTTE
ncbi:gastric triacylglycerol lipase-like [Plodia interpunctella]|uniref:gastric triacylglycerol lipase-like n=1 Tax=Plodia interpunctella TaxID=58824 RepID=UPI0023683627|nr:gastric triacylglycerol lipase-like [Plodia interpunctella]